MSFPQINFESLKAQRYPKLHGLRGSRKVGERWLGKGLSDFLIHYPIGLVSSDMFIKPHPPWSTEVIRKRNNRANLHGVQRQAHDCKIGMGGWLIYQI